MGYIFTFVAANSSKPIKNDHISDFSALLSESGLKQAGGPVWLCPEKAVDIAIGQKPERPVIEGLRSLCAPLEVDVFINPAQNRRKKLLLADMDSTIVTGETLDDLAAFAGLKDKIAAITAQAMEGKLDFHEAIRARVGLLKDLPASALHETLAETKLSPGAETLVRTMSAQGAFCALVSGGFTFFTGAIAEKLGFNAHHGNELGIENGKLTGLVLEPIQDKFAKLEYLKSYCAQHGLNTSDAMTIGDGANDLPMLSAAGLGVGYQPKNVVLEHIDNAIMHGDLSAALYAQGYTNEEIT